MAIEREEDRAQAKNRKPARKRRQSHRLGRGTFGEKSRVPQAKARKAGASHVGSTPLRIFVTGVNVKPAHKERMRVELGRNLWRFGGDITRAYVRLLDLNGPRGGIDTVCRIKLSVAGLDHIVVEAREADAMTAFRRATKSVRNAIERAMERHGRNAKRVELPEAEEEGREPPAKRPEGGSLIGRRVGRARENLMRVAQKPGRKDEWVDTSLPGTSATDRKAGGGSTAARNVRLRARKATATLEDSAKDRPSRKSSRRSANRAKSGSQIARAKKRAHSTPTARARRKAAKGARAGGAR